MIRTCSSCGCAATDSDPPEEGLAEEEGGALAGGLLAVGEFARLPALLAIADGSIGGRVSV